MQKRLSHVRFARCDSAIVFHRWFDDFPTSSSCNDLFFNKSPTRVSIWKFYHLSKRQINLLDILFLPPFWLILDRSRRWDLIFGTINFAERGTFRSIKFLIKVLACNKVPYKVSICFQLNLTRPRENLKFCGIFDRARCSLPADSFYPGAINFSRLLVSRDRSQNNMRPVWPSCLADRRLITRVPRQW